MECEVSKKQSCKNIIYLIKILLMCVLFISVVFEIILFPSLENLCGCIMMIICYLVFINIFLKQYIVVNFPFGFMMFLSMFMYRFLPLPATLLEGIPVSYGMEVPIKTFLLETILFLVSSCAFYFAISTSNSNNLIQRVFNKIGFYKPINRSTVWIIGIIGCLIRIIMFSIGSITIGNVLGKFITPFIPFMYIPMILFFPGFYTGSYEKKPNLKQPIVWMYLIFITILNLASNSRESIIEPIAMIALFYIFYLCINNIPAKKVIDPRKLIPILLISFISLNLLTIVSDGILSIRDDRSEYTFTELIELTFDKIINQEQNNEDDKSSLYVAPYEAGWTETYLSNFILNRYANMRISDETLYLGERIIESNNRKIMVKDFFDRIVVILPQPLIDILGFDIDKNEYQSSRGDALYVYSGIGNRYNWGGFRVTSHIGDGILTFGILYLLIQCIIFFIVFKLLNCYSYRNKNNTIAYSVYGLFSIYTSLNLFRNANGMLTDIYFITRNYWQEIILFMIIFNFAHFISRIRIK